MTLEREKGDEERQRDRENERVTDLERNSVNEVPERDPGLHLSLEVDEDGLGHVQRHRAHGSGERDEARSWNSQREDLV